MSFYEDLSLAVCDERKRKRDIYEQDTYTESEDGFAFFVLFDLYKTPFIEAEYQKLKQIERITSEEEVGFKNRILVLLQKEKIRVLEQELNEAKHNKATVALLSPIADILATNDLLKETLTDMARKMGEIEAENSRIKENVSMQMKATSDRLYAEANERREKARGELDTVYAAVIRDLKNLAKNASPVGVRLFIDQFIEQMEKVRLINECQ